MISETTRSSLDSLLSPDEAFQLALVRMEQIAQEKRRRLAGIAATHPVDFAQNILSAKLAPYQSEILAALAEHRRIAVRGPHGLGKTMLAACAVLWGLATFGDDTKIITTASAWRQLTKFLWPEIRKWAHHWQDSGVTMQMLNAYRGDAEAFAVASDNPAYIEGAHAAKLLYVFDEAKAIPDETWNAAEGAFATGDCYALAISTPGDRIGRFWDIHRRAPGYEDWLTRHVTLAEAIAAGRISQPWADDRKRQWGEASPLYQARVLGEFPTQGDDSLFSLTWIESAIERGRADGFIMPSEGECVAGQDVARYGSDDSANIVRRGPVVTIMQTWHGNDTMETTGRARRIALDYGARLQVDEIGVGAGVVDRLNELNGEKDTQGIDFQGINVGNPANDSEKFANLRAEICWGLRERFYAGDITFVPDIPQELLDRLTGELTSLKYKTNSRGQIVIESKDDMRKRGLPSPDLADALMLAFAFSDSGGWTHL